jgi:isoquinoline 1-oxidoreductase subunit beta
VRAEAALRRPGVIAIFAVRWGVAVVADKHWQALAAAREVEVDWAPGLVEDLDTEELRAAARAYRGGGTKARSDGDVGRALTAAGATRVEAYYEAPFLAHAPMEPQNCTVRLSPGKAEVWVPCQAPTVVQVFVADAVGLDRDDVLVHTTYAGGGFGRRVVADYAAQAAVIARKVGRPVQLLWTRASDMTQGFYRPQTAASMRGAVKDGRATALGAHVLGQSIVLDSKDMVGAVMPSWMPAPLQHVMIDAGLAMFGTGTLPDMFATEGLANTPYQIANLAVAFSPVRTRMPVASWRSVGHSFNGFAIESFVDELAAAAGQDPLAFRQAMLPAGSRPRRVLDAVAALAGWGTPAPAGVGRGLARHGSFESEVAEVAEVEIVDGRIRVRKVYVVIDCGVAVNPDGVRAQVEGAIIFGLSAALDQAITMKGGVVQETNFDTYRALRMYESPEIVVQIMDSDDPPTGAGEPGLPPIAPAVANAIYAATKVRLRRLPLQRAWDERERGS